jgi:restriction system protein
VQTEDEPGVAWADSDALVDKITDVYERLPGEIQAEVPLRRIWTLVPDED